MTYEDLLRQASLTTATLASLLRRLKTSPWIASVDLPVTIPAGDTSVSALHGLRRAFNGATIVGQTDATRTVAVSLPDTRAETLLTVSLSSAHADDFTIHLRVY